MTKKDVSVFIGSVLLVHLLWFTFIGMQSFSFRRVAYGGINGTYYSCTEGRRVGDDGVRKLSRIVIGLLDCYYTH